MFIKAKFEEEKFWNKEKIWVGKGENIRAEDFLNWNFNNIGIENFLKEYG